MAKLNLCCDTTDNTGIDTGALDTYSWLSRSDNTWTDLCTPTLEKSKYIIICALFCVQKLVSNYKV